MKKKGIIYILLLFSQILYSQEYKMTGSIINMNNEPIENAEILLLSKDSAALKSELTDGKGFFSIQAISGNYIIQVKQLKDILYSRNINLQANLNIGEIKISQARSIKEIVLEGKKKLIERKVDRWVFNVENSISASGGDALDVLKVTPNLRVQNDQISMIGKSSMTVMINDKLMRLSGEDLGNFLKTIKSDDIKSIEVISNPPAKYDAEGNSGIVNIVLKKNIPDTWNASVSGTLREASYATGSMGGSFNYQRKKLSLFLNANYINGSKKGIEKETIKYHDQDWDNNFGKRIYTDIFSTRLGGDYKLTDKWTLGVQYMGSFNKPHTDQKDVTYIFNKSMVLDSLINTRSYEEKKINTNSFNVYSVIKLDSLGKKISMDLDYLNYGNSIDRNFQTQMMSPDNIPLPYGYTGARNTGTQDIGLYSGKIDVEHPFKWMDLSYGAKLSFSKTKYNNTYFDTSEGSPVMINNRSNAFNYTENTQALYASANKKITDKWQVQLGLRVENTQTEGNSLTLQQINKKNYTEFFPTAYLLYKYSEKDNLSINYGRRLSRPRYNELNPFKVYYNPYSYSEGNPYLTPQFTNNIELQHSYHDILFSSLSYSHTTKGLGNPPFFDEATKVQYLYDLNYYTSDSYNISETYILKKIKWWESENQANLYYTKSSFLKELNIKDAKGWGFYFSTNNRFTITPKIKGEINFWYQAPQYEDLYRKRGMSSLDIAIRFTMLKSKLQVVATVQDIFKGTKDKGRMDNGTYYSYSNYYDNRFFRLSLLYRFGSNKVNVKKRDFGNEEEKKRIGN